MTELYKLSNDALVLVERGKLATEEMIEAWIVQNSHGAASAGSHDPLGLNLLIIGRQVETDFSGRIDLLGIDEEGNLVILELKRATTPRNIIAQVLDYASWVVTLTTRQVHEIALEYLGRNLEQEFQDRFEAALPETLNQSHTMVIIASAYDAASQRIVRYLSETHNIAINTAFFTVFNDNGQTLLATEWLLDQSEVASRAQQTNLEPWTPEKVLETLRETCSEKEFEIAQKIVDWMRKDGRTLLCGPGIRNGSVYPLLQPNGVPINPVFLSTNRKLRLQLKFLEDKPVFGPLDKRRDLMKQFAIQGTNFGEADLAKNPAIKLSTIAADPDGLSKILSALKWIDEQIADQPSS